jgi:hypothetical protein
MIGVRATHVQMMIKAMIPSPNKAASIYLTRISEKYLKTGSLDSL